MVFVKEVEMGKTTAIIGRYLYLKHTFGVTLTALKCLQIVRNKTLEAKPRNCETNGR